MSISLEIRGIEKLARKLKAATRLTTLIDAVTAGAFHIQAWIVTNRLTGPRPQFLGRVTSRLATSISVIRGQRIGNAIVSKIGTNVIYAPVHEFGSPAKNIPARPFLRPALKDRRNRRFILDLLKNRIERAVQAQA